MPPNPTGNPASRAAEPAPWLAFLGLSVIVLVYLWIASVSLHRIDGRPPRVFADVFSTGCGDFEHFYLAARALRSGADLYATGGHGYIYPPLIAFLYQPLTLLDVKSAAAVMLAVNIGLGLGCTWLASTEILRRFELPDHASQVLVVAASSTLLAATRLRSEIQMWQTNLLMMAAMLVSLRWLDRRPWIAGLALGFAINIKYLPIVLLPYLILRRRYRAAAGFVLGTVAFALLPALVSGWTANLANLAEALGGVARLFGAPIDAAGAAHVDPIGVGYSISVTSSLARGLGQGSPGWLAIVMASAAALTCLLAVFAAYRAQPPRSSGAAASATDGMVGAEWMAAIAFSIAFSPQTNPRHASLLLTLFTPLAAIAWLSSDRRARGWAIATAAVLWLAIVLPPVEPAFADAVRWWRRVGGLGWCIAAALPLYAMATLAQLRATRQHPAVEVAPAVDARHPGFRSG